MAYGLSSRFSVPAKDNRTLAVMLAPAEKHMDSPLAINPTWIVRLVDARSAGAVRTDDNSGGHGLLVMVVWSWGAGGRLLQCNWRANT